MSAAEKIEREAAGWLLRQEEPDWSAADQTSLEAWLAVGPAHKLAYWRLAHGWEKVGRLAALRPADPRPKGRPRGTSLVRKPWAPALAASLVLAVVGTGLLAPQLWRLGGKAYATELGGKATVPLADGSRIELNTATRVRTAVSRRARQVWLDRGEAYFEVAHDPAHPFVVHAGAKTITVLGTRFSVRRDGDRVEVAVAEGRVRVESATPAGLRAAAPAATAPPVLTRGEVAVAQGPSMMIADKGEGAVAAELAWRQGMLSFDQVTLEDAAQEFNRYNRKKLVIGDPAVAAVRIGGSFQAENIEAFARLLQQVHGLRIADDGRELKILP